jgi:hypothetical protein
VLLTSTGIAWLADTKANNAPRHKHSMHVFLLLLLLLLLPEKEQLLLLGPGPSVQLYCSCRHHCCLLRTSIIIMFACLVRLSPFSAHYLWFQHQAHTLSVYILCCLLLRTSITTLVLLSLFST